MFEDAEDEVDGALARANMTAMITTAMTATPSGQIRLFPITIFCLHWTRPNKKWMGFTSD
jgi:hypothetical protein